MALPTLTEMVKGAKIPLGSPGSLFKNPASQAIGALASTASGMGTIGAIMSIADPGFSPSAALGAIQSSVAGITTSVTASINSMSTDLPLAMSAQVLRDRAQSVDAIMAKNINGIPNQIQAAFPIPGAPKDGSSGETPCPSNHVVNAMAPITESNNMVNAGNDQATKGFDNSGAMASLYTALNALPGVNITNGKELLAFLGNIPPALSGAVNSILSSIITPGSAILTQLKGSFSSTETTMAKLSSDFTKVVNDAAASLAESLNFLGGSHIVSLIGNETPCISNVMNAVVNPSMVNPIALATSDSIKTKEVLLPGQESVVATTNIEKPVSLASPENKPRVTAAEIISPQPGQPSISPYTAEELQGFKVRVDDQKKVWDKISHDASLYYKDNVEDWKKRELFYQKAEKAGATPDNTVGTSKDPEVLAEWKDVQERFLVQVGMHREIYGKPYREAKVKYLEMKIEFEQRTKYGKNPYTYQIANGISIPEGNQYTVFDSTK